MNLPTMTMDEHTYEAKCIIGKFAKRSEKSSWAFSYDCVEMVTEAIIKAHYKFDPSKGFKRSTYIVTAGRFAILKFKTKLAKELKKREEHENNDTSNWNIKCNKSIPYDNDTNGINFNGIVDWANNEEEIDHDKIKQLAHKFINSGLLTDKQKNNIKMYYIDGMSAQSIANTLGVSKHCVQLSINGGLKCLQEYMVTNKLKQKFENCYR